jgi:DNA helicase-2/ATP-dependent DNA helicase PcrA
MDASHALDEARFGRLDALVERITRRLPGPDPAVFAYIRVQGERSSRDIFFGPRASTDAEPFVLDARTAPLARLLYDLSPGEEYELDVDGREVSGVLLERARLVLDGTRLVAIEEDDCVLRRSELGAITREPLRSFALAPPRTTPVGGFGEGVVLDPIQRGAAAAPAGEPMLVTGEAGAGKTTVALARLVHLARATTPFRGLYVAPTEALARFVGLSLDRARVEGVEVTSFDALAVRLARRAFRGLPRRVVSEAPAAVIRLKRSDALAHALEGFVAARPRLGDDEDRPGQAAREDLLLLFGDRDGLDVVQGQSSLIRASDVEATLLHTRAQFRLRGEEEFADVVDAARLSALDARSLDAGTPDDLAGSMDVEDIPVLFELARLRGVAERKRVPLPETFDAVVIDEAQELAVLELRLLRRLLSEGGTLVVAGDEEQRTDVGAGFRSFDVTLAELGAPNAERVHLETSYRCPPELTDVVRELRTTPSLVVPHASSTIVAHAFPNELHVVMDLAASIRRIREHDVRATVAIVARTASTARRIAGPLAAALSVELALDGKFDFRRGLHVTTVSDVRGLEFDYVFLPDVDAATYPSDDESRRALYLALTRTCAAVSVAWVGRASPMIRNIAHHRGGESRAAPR